MQETSKINQKKILLIHLVSMGDCLYVTTIARQIKEDYPGCHLTWAISSRCLEVIKNNPYIDEIWEIFSETSNDCYSTVWEATKQEALKRKENGIYDKIFLTQICPDNISNFDGTVRSSTFRGYPNPITVPIAPVIVLTNEEILNVKNFVQNNFIEKFKKVILFESSPGSGQSPINNSFALAISKRIVNHFDDAIIILTSNQKITTDHDRIIDASELTYRENAELSKYCNLLVGCSSGITWLLTSTWAKKIPTIQILKNNALTLEFASVRYDLSYWGESTEHIIEITKFDSEYIYDCIQTVLKEGILKSQKKYNETLKPSRKSLGIIIFTLLYTKKNNSIVKVIKNYYDRNRDLLIVFVFPHIIYISLYWFVFGIVKRLRKLLQSP